MRKASQRVLGKLSQAWTMAKVQTDVTFEVDAVAREHGEPTSMLTGDWISLSQKFKDMYGEDIHDSRLPSQPHFEAFEEKLADQDLQPETLASASPNNRNKSKQGQKIIDRVSIWTARLPLKLNAGTCLHRQQRSKISGKCTR